MPHLIDKAALVAEIERRKECCAKQREDMLNVQCHTLADNASERMGELNCIQDFLDTLEVKEVNSNDAFIENACDAYCAVCDTKECQGCAECSWVIKFRRQLMKLIK